MDVPVSALMIAQRFSSSAPSVDGTLSTSVSILIIAAVLFLVTMALAFGPLCWLFVSSSETCKPRRRGRPSVVGATVAGALVAGVAAFVAGIYFARSGEIKTATLVDESRSVEAESAGSAHAPIRSEQSLFERTSAQETLSGAGPRVSHQQKVATVVLPLMLLGILLSFVAAGRLRGSVIRLLPVVVAVGLLVVLFLRTSVHHEIERAVTAERHAIQQAAVARHQINMRVAQAQKAAVLRALPVKAPVIAENPGHEQAGSTPVDTSSTDGTADTAVASADTTTAPGITEYVGTNVVGVPRESLPDWTHDVDAVGTMQVIRSGPHATVELAEQHALTELRSLLQSQFVKQHPEARSWQPPDDVVLHSGSILRRAVERSQITVGEFTNPMYEAYWQVDPTIGTVPLANAWRPTVVRERLTWLGGGIGLLTLLLGSLAAGLRVDEQTEGKRRKALTLGTLALWAVVGGAALFVA